MYVLIYYNVSYSRRCTFQQSPLLANRETSSPRPPISSRSYDCDKLNCLHTFLLKVMHFYRLGHVGVINQVDGPLRQLAQLYSQSGSRSEVGVYWRGCLSDSLISPSFDDDMEENFKSALLIVPEKRVLKCVLTLLIRYNSE